MTELHDRETRTTDHATGGQKGAKLTQLGALDPLTLIVLSRVAGMGAIKYSAHNFMKGYDWSLSFNAMMRHALLFWAGEDYDYCTVPEHLTEGTPRLHEYREDCNGSGQPHMAHAAWMALCLVSFLERELGTDDRPPQAMFPEQRYSRFDLPLEPGVQHSFTCGSCNWGRNGIVTSANEYLRHMAEVHAEEG